MLPSDIGDAESQMARPKSIIDEESDSDDVEIEVFDTSRIHAEKSVEMALKQL